MNPYAPPDILFGPLFEAVQAGRIFPDSKTFADFTPKLPAELILERYLAGRSEAGFSLKAFVLEHFELPHHFAGGFEADKSRPVEEHINALWPVLSRQADQKAAGSSLIPLPHPYIVPGGRFGEIYYWDSYFTMLGLQAAGRADMIGQMVDNFSYLIDTFGFIPNGNRTYFLSRSQPPFFSLMVRLLLEETGEALIGKYLPFLEKEYAFWMDGAGGLGNEKKAEKRLARLPDGSLLNRYWDSSDKPRQESYAEDLELAEASGRDSRLLFRNLRAACESGWDFSARWFRDGITFSTIRTTELAPVDLNALLYHLEAMIARGYAWKGEMEMLEFYQRKAEQRRDALLYYCWEEESGYFLDYDFVHGQPTGIPTLATAFPLFFRLATDEQAGRVAQNIRQYFLKAGGLVSTLIHSGQQWDAPNGWAPLQWVAIQGLRNYGHFELAEEIKKRWVALNVRVYENTGKMVEKYNVEDMSLTAGGGEYPVQDGFGWSNGVLLRLLKE